MILYLLFRFNSPGGIVAMYDSIFRKLIKFSVLRL